MDRLAELGSNKEISKVIVVPLPHSEPTIKGAYGTSLDVVEKPHATCWNLKTKRKHIRRVKRRSWIRSRLRFLSAFEKICLEKCGQSPAKPMDADMAVKRGAW